MPYVGPAPNPGQNREVDDISSGFNGSEVNFTLQVNSQNVSPGSPNNIIVSLGGVVQNPSTDYNIAASTITFTTAPASGLSFFGLVLGQQVDIQSLADGTSPTMSSPTITGDLTVDTSTLKVDASNNRVGIGTSSPLALLDVSLLGSGSRRLLVNYADSVITVQGANSSSTNENLRITGDNLIFSSGSGTGTERMRVLSGGGLTFNGDTATANALDDYEEGTFSPTFGASNGSSTTTYTTQQGAYTKIGNTVFFNIYIVLNSISTSIHSVIVIGALPFTNTGNRVSIHSIRSSGFQGSGDDSRPFAGTVEANNTKIELVKAVSGGTSDFTTSNSQGGTIVYIAGQYPVS